MGEFAKYKRIAEGDFEELKRRYGTRWAHQRADEISLVAERERYIRKKVSQTGEDPHRLRARWNEANWQDLEERISLFVPE